MGANDTLPSLAALEALKRIVHHIGAANEAVTATKLKRTLGLSDQLFQLAADYGCSQKIIKWNAHNKYSGLKDYVVPEEAYYDTVMTSIEALWLSEGYERNHFYIENTSRRNSKIEGPWTRPDLTLVSHKKFPWTMGTEFDVVTFEIKRPDSANVLAVFEALSHVAAATRAYVVFPVDAEAWRKSNPAQERRVKDECVRHGVGLILVNSSSSEIAQHVLKASRREIDHEKCSDFLDAVVSPGGKRRISEWKS
ncbi:hypothetical protein IHQ71_20915 [Rhizobium sp. TH2]|uniref:hypothetical protein n=1 Tax=Rhizobium sp. TH2 TaxID=2775403 RepID=UPI002157F13A|nr:hypothetical protein [Rhizobium sp. TH2]UVC07635.1 hypothetical protein IHQ71_20915 [Rhizobium sp. TH2]